MHTSGFSECFTMYSDLVKTFSEGQFFIVPKLKPCVELCNAVVKGSGEYLLTLQVLLLIYMNEWLSKCLKKITGFF